jgi:hypothetical protein
MSTWEERMAARAAARRPAVKLDEMPAGDRARIAAAGPVTAHLRDAFLAARPDLDPDWRDAILAAPIEVYAGGPYDSRLTPYNPADYPWSEAEVWAGSDCCSECVVARPPGRGLAAHFGWSLEQTCHFQCGHKHHDDEVWIA